ncbi:MAG TPA: hypothetical protein VHN98_01265 [Acidimicrobiales bacterium]|nr:hypothetical protein [Acidimicrobiales bacterium]
MALVLVRLKLTLLRHGIAASGTRGVVGAVLAALAAVGTGVTAGLLLLFLRAMRPGDATDALAAAYAIVLVVWVFGPIVAAGSEGTLEPDRLALFPLGIGRLMPGLLLAALLGFGGVATVLVLAGSVAGMAPASPLVAVTVAAAALELCICVTAGRLVATLVSAAARTRRWRDLALLLGPVVALGLNVALQVVVRQVDPRAADFRTTRTYAVVRTLTRVLPSGPPAMAIGFAREGNVVAALLALAAGGGVLFVGIDLWHAALQRVLTSGGGSGAAPPGRRGADLFPAALRFLPRTRVGAVAAKELRLTWRDPRQRAAFFGVVFASVVPLLSLRVLGSTDPHSVLFAAMPAYVVGSTATNLYGFDGAALWTNVAAGDDARRDLLGKCVARALLAVPLVTVALVGLVARTHAPGEIVPTIGLAVAALGVGLGAGTVASVVAPFPVSDTRSNVFSSGNAGQGLSAALPSLGVLAAGAVVLGPVVAALVALRDPVARAALGVAGAAAGAIVFIVGFGIAVRRSAPRQPELLDALGPRRTA